MFCGRVSPLLTFALLAFHCADYSEAECGKKRAETAGKPRQWHRTSRSTADEKKLSKDPNVTPYSVLDHFWNKILPANLEIVDEYDDTVPESDLLEAFRPSDDEIQKSSYRELLDNCDRDDDKNEVNAYRCALAGIRCQDICLRGAATGTGFCASFSSFLAPTIKVRRLVEPISVSCSIPSTLTGTR